MRAASTSLAATEAEAEAIELVVERLRISPPPLLSDDDDLVHMQVLRFVREHGTNVGNIEKRFRAALEWRATNLPPIPERPDGGWMSSSEMPNGEWATQFVAIALNAGYSKAGNPVKIERLGKFDLRRLNKESRKDKTVRPRFNEFYLGLIEFLQRQLDTASVQQGYLSQTYEIFDLEGLDPTVIFNTMVINFLKDVLIAFSTHYPSSFRKAVIINTPSWMPKIWKMVSAVLPKSVTAKVNIVGKDYHTILQEDLPPDTLAWIASSHAQLIRAPHSPA